MTNIKCYVTSFSLSLPTITFSLCTFPNISDTQHLQTAYTSCRWPLTPKGNTFTELIIFSLTFVQNPKTQNP